MKDAFEEGAPEAKPEQRRERAVEGPCKDMAREDGWFVRKHRTPGHNGAPDDYFAKNGRIFWVEFKKPDEPPDADQLVYHAEMRAAGLTVYVCDRKGHFRQILRVENARADAR
jgi:hypothetical protein